MQSLPRSITSQIFATPETYYALRKHWSVLTNSDLKHDLEAVHYLLYLALLGKDWRKAFAPITNRRKLDNGAFPYGWGLFHALVLLHNPWYQRRVLAPFEGIVTLAMLQAVRQLVPHASFHEFKPESFTAASFPFDAYQVPEMMLGTASAKEHTMTEQ